MKAAVRLPTPLRTLAQSGSLTKSRFAKSPKRASLMSISLYDLSVPTFLQTVNALAGVPPFHFQIEAAWHHAVWGLEAARTGAFTPPALVGPVPFGDLQGMMEKAKRAPQQRRSQDQTVRFPPNTGHFEFMSSRPSLTESESRG